jgi:hypothetical protein
MNDLRFACHTVLLSSLFFVAFTGPSHAYVDPGSASIAITAILGGIAAIGYTARLYWERFKSLFKVASKSRPANDRT